MRVVKFGGSSLADGAQVAKVVAIMKANPARQVIVTSAPGKRHPGDVKVTDLLIMPKNHLDSLIPNNPLSIRHPNT